MLVDSHCHLNLLDLNEYDKGIDTVLANARDQQVGHLLCVATSLENTPTVIDFAQRYTGISASAGVHPNEFDGETATVDRLLQLGAHEKSGCHW